MQTTVTARPLATQLFEVIPCTGIQFPVLRTDVGKQERLLLGIGTPLAICRRTHVTTVVARAGIVRCRGTTPGNGIIFLKINALTIVLTTRFFFCQFPCHPIWLTGFCVVVGGICYTSQQSLIC